MQVDDLSSVYDRVSKNLESAGHVVHPPKVIDFGIQLEVEVSGMRYNLRVYQNKKGRITYDYSLIRDSRVLEMLKQIISGNPETPAQGLCTGADQIVIGSDESGKGDFFGPLVCAAFCLRPEQARRLSVLGVRDSKSLSDNQVMSLSERLVDEYSDSFSVVEIGPEKYNELYLQFRMEGKNLNDLLAWSHSRAIEDLLSRVDCDVVVVDQFANEAVLIGRLLPKGRKTQVLQMHRAEQHLAVAAASIIARAHFLQRLAALSTSVGISLPKGASEVVVQAGRQLVQRYGPEILSRLAKTHFKTMQACLGVKQRES